MYKHRARMTQRRYEILILIAKGYKNKQIARKMGLSMSNTKVQKWRLYCYLDVHCANDAVFMGIQIGMLSLKELSKSMKGIINATIAKQRKSKFEFKEG